MRLESNADSLRRKVKRKFEFATEDNFLFRTNLFVFAILDTSLEDTLNDSLQSLIYLLRGFGRFVGPLLYITVDCLCYERRQK